MFLPKVYHVRRNKKQAASLDRGSPLLVKTYFAAKLQRKCLIRGLNVILQELGQIVGGVHPAFQHKVEHFGMEVNRCIELFLKRIPKQRGGCLCDADRIVYLSVHITQAWRMLVRHLRHLRNREACRRLGYAVIASVTAWGDTI